MDPFLIASAFTAFFIASFLKGLTGIGFSTLCLGFLALMVDIRLAIPLVFLPSLSSNLMVMADAGHFKESVKRFWPLFVSGIPGLFIGIWFLRTSHTELPRMVLGLVMALYGIWGLKKGELRLGRNRERRSMVPIGFISGIVNGATGSQIMPIMPYLLALDMGRSMFVQTINLSFTINTLLMITALGSFGFVTLPVVGISLAGILPVGLGIFLGSRLRRKVPEEIFRKLVFTLLIGLGSFLLIRPFFI